MWLGLNLEWIVHPRASNAVSSTGLESGVCLYNRESQYGLLEEHAPCWRSAERSLDRVQPLPSGTMLYHQLKYRREVSSASISPRFSNFLTLHDCGFGARSLLLHVEETFHASNRQSTNANAVCDPVHGAIDASGRIDDGLIILNANPSYWEGQSGPKTVTSLLLGLVLLYPGAVLVSCFFRPAELHLDSHYARLCGVCPKVELLLCIACGYLVNVIRQYAGDRGWLLVLLSLVPIWSNSGV